MIAAFLASMVEGSAARDDCDILATVSTCFGSRDGTIDIHASKEGSATTVPTSDGRPVRMDALAASCLDARTEALAQGAVVPPQIQARCGGAGPVVTADLVLRAFRELPLYRGGVNTDPRGWTLVNLETYFWCGDSAGQSCAVVGEPEQVVTLLGRPVRVRPRIISYRWSFGDGAERTVAAGAGRVGHAYRRQGAATVRVTLTWTADFSVAGQPFLPIGGTTTTTSPPLALPIRAARPVLVGGG
jgi:hypothetical protein